MNFFRRFGSAAILRRLPLLLCVVPIHVSAAQISEADYTSLVEEAAKVGYVPVVVSVGSPSVADVDRRPQEALTAVKQKTLAVFAELGLDAWTEGFWENRLGQLHLHVPLAGLVKLRASRTAVSFWRGESSALTALRLNPGFGELEGLVHRYGSASAIVIPRNELTAYDLSSGGRTIARSGQFDRADVNDRLSRTIDLLAQVGRNPGATATQYLKEYLASSRPDQPRLPVTVDARALLALAYSADVAGVLPPNYADTTPPLLDSAALSYAERKGSAEVLIHLRDPLPSHRITAREFNLRREANRRALEDTLSTKGISAELGDLSAIGIGAVILSAQQIASMYSNPDPRIKAIILNKPLMKLADITNNLQLNVAPWWAAGYQGNYASGVANPPNYPIRVVVFDSGVLRTHPMLTGKIGWEACFATNFDLVTSSGTIVFESHCPLKNSAGDSPLFSPGSNPPAPVTDAGRPYYGALCATDGMLDASVCSHGTHVAGIAVGNGDGRKGVAPLAIVDTIQVVSVEKRPNPIPNGYVAKSTIFMRDVFEGLNSLLTVFTQPGTQNDHVVNLSLGSDVLSLGQCSSGTSQIFGGAAPIDTPTIQAFVGVVQQLRDRGVPVIAAAGNVTGGRQWFGLQFSGFPACVPGVIQAMASRNDGLGTTLASYSYTPDPAEFPVGSIWVATGGDAPSSSWGVESAWNTPQQAYRKISGTSQAAPHVSGVYALVKGWFRKNGIPFTVDGASAWLRDAASFEQTWDLAALSTGAPPGASLPKTYRVLRLPSSTFP